MKFSAVALFAVVLGIAAAVLPAMAKPILPVAGFRGPALPQPRIGITIRPPVGNAPFAMNIPPVSARDDVVNLDNVVWNAKRMIDIPCTKALNSGGPLPASCTRPWNPLLGVSKVVARALLVGGLYH
ncbi:hypothetical protein PsYK624_075290 [Phanerochaete sordida]|uniref:Uncharacterized protein n=1 Tax=Phanerochaete sordida TaxID=48140 RepID=A0A9P3GBL7_9APHY|nr:hypothetical protein PsYK624_075290 [Phanerochaete sordida]